jgi:hypothetical protein
MLSLNIGSRPLVTLPASAFPEQANTYLCDKCGRDITIHFQQGQAHVWRTMGPERYQCLCGQKYLTGATEWVHFSDWERKNRIGGTLLIGFLISLLFSVLGLLVYLALHFVFGLSDGALITAVVITALPFCWMQLDFWRGVVASMLRTRIGSQAD